MGKIIQGLLLVCCTLFVTAQIRGGSTKRHRRGLAESDGHIDLTADISEAEIRRIKQRYLGELRVSSGPHSPLYVSSNPGGRKDKDYATPAPTEYETMMEESMSYSMSMSMSMSMV